MPTKIRLQRKGKKGQPFYHLVVADGRAPRDGRFIERLGTYNPMTHPATIEINFERALYWVQVGAQPTDTARSILSHKGVLLKYHLLKGVKKGALTEDQVEEKFQDWLKDKEEKLTRLSKDKELSEKEILKKQLEEEKKINEAKAAELAKKRAAEKFVPAAEKAVDEEKAADEAKKDIVEEAQSVTSATSLTSETSEASASEPESESGEGKEAPDASPETQNADPESDSNKEK